MTHMVHGELEWLADSSKARKERISFCTLLGFDRNVKLPNQSKKDFLETKCLHPGELFDEQFSLVFTLLGRTVLHGLHPPWTPRQLPILPGNQRGNPLSRRRMGQLPPPWPSWSGGLSSRIRALHLMLVLLLRVFTTQDTRDKFIISIINT